MAQQQSTSIPRRPPVEVRASTKRRSTVSASWDDGRIVVLVPSRLGTAERDAVVDELVQRLLRRAPMLHSDNEALGRRCLALGNQYLDGIGPASVRWVDNQRKRWGSCCPNTATIRISSRLRPVPSWVLDAVLVHELAHLIEPNHSKRFRQLAARYPRMDEADTFLHGFSIGLEAAIDQERQWFAQPDAGATQDGSDDSEPEGCSRGLMEHQDDSCCVVDQGRLFDFSD
ncbi:MAG: M48 family metallopeptidase [Acidimicrobiales bacterium]